MNESFLQENPLLMFDDFVQIPDEAFEDIGNASEISALMDTIMENDDFARVLKSLWESNPKVVVDTRDKLNGFIKDAEAGKYGNGNKKDYIKAFAGRAVYDIDQIIKYDGVFPEVKIKCTKTDPKAILPKYQDAGDAGADIYALGTYEIKPGETVVVKTGIKVIVPGGYELQIRPRSGLSLKTGLRIANAPGTIDAGYRNEVGVIVTNTGTETEKITEATRIAQMVLKRAPKIVWDEISNEEFDKYQTDRGAGFGSSGV